MSRHAVSRTSLLFGLGTAILAVGAARASAQGWTAQLVLSPVASPFLSDWELDPTAAQLIVTSPASTATDVTFHYSLTRNGQVLLRGTTDPQIIPARESVVFTGTSTFGGRADWNRDVQQIVARTGRLPEGEYEGCVTLAGPGGIVLVERQCARFSTQSSDPPFLVFPMNGDTVTSRDPIFEWQPVHLPAMADARIGYVLQIAEVRSRQLPEVALQSNILHYVEPNLVQTSHQYPVGGLPLVSGRTYAWRVQALDGDGRPAAANQGRSEIWTFVYRETESEPRATVARIALDPSRDTLRYAGDTVRFEVTAYDADNVEIRGKRVQWRAIDTTVARVDSTGTVTGVAAGETRIVASVDGVADSALSVMAVPTGLAVRFQRYDAETDKPSLLELVQSGSFEEVAPKLMEILQSGEFVIPLPRLPGVERALAAPAQDSAGMQDDESKRSGPSAGTDSHGARIAEEACTDAAFNARDPYLDINKKVFVFYIPLNAAQWQQVPRCLGVPNPSTGEVEEAERLHGLIFVASWSHPGVPRVFLAFKGLGLGLTLFGPQVDVQYLVLNLTREMEVGSEALPANFGGYFGDVKFEAGTGVTFYSRRRCAPATITPLCQIVTAINESHPDITIKAFAGVKESERTLEFEREQTHSTSGSKLGAKVGSSRVLGFDISATLPVRHLEWDVGDFGIDSIQLGIEFSAERETEKERGETAKVEDKVAPKFKITSWFTGTGGIKRQLNGEVGFEDSPDSNPAKLVVSAELEQTWQLAILRFGKPKLELKVPLGKGPKPVSTELALSGSWGVGPALGFDITDPDKDPFAEMGSGEITVKWTPLLTGDPLAKARVQREDAISAANRQLQVVEDARARVEQARRERMGPLASESAYTAADKAIRDAEAALTKATADLAQRRKDRKEAQDAVNPYCWKKTKSGKCVSFATKLAVDDGALLDVAALVVRFVTGAQ